MSRYNTLFFDYVDAGALRSARAFTEILMPEIKIESMLDVGCGRGGWAATWKAAGCTKVIGVDGDYVDRSALMIAPEEFRAENLNKPFDLGEQFDLVQSLEVAEHLRPETSESFIQTLIRHSDIVLFSAAVPGQGGTTHINERPMEFWRRLFRKQGYHAYDFIRARVAGNKAIEPWYRFNTMLFVSEIGEKRISQAIRMTRVDERQKIAEGGSLGWRARRFLVGFLPQPAVDRLAVINAALTMRMSRHR